MQSIAASAGGGAGASVGDGGATSSVGVVVVHAPSNRPKKTASDSHFNQLLFIYLLLRILSRFGDLAFVSSLSELNPPFVPDWAN
jgi:hypothetical protein